uniref:Tc1-like transposase DDE domain-containing protein n=1 Tax=Salarias fasciatus TaxID=181472 RepID=A0A672IF62_SALFA
MIKLLEDGNSTCMAAKDVFCSQSAVWKICTDYKRHGKAVKVKRTGRPRKTSGRQDKQKMHKTNEEETGGKLESLDVTELCDDAGNLVWCCSSEIYKEDYLKKTSKFPQSLMIWGCVSGKGSGETAVVKSSINAQVYIDILDSFLIPSIEKKMFGDDGIIFQDDNASCHRAKTVKAFLGERRIQSMQMPAHSPDLNPTEDL